MWMVPLISSLVLASLEKSGTYFCNGTGFSLSSSLSLWPIWPILGSFYYLAEHFFLAIVQNADGKTLFRNVASCIRSLWLLVVCCAWSGHNTKSLLHFTGFSQVLAWIIHPLSLIIFALLSEYCTCILLLSVYYDAHSKSLKVLHPCMYWCNEGRSWFFMYISVDNQSCIVVAVSDAWSRIAQLSLVNRHRKGSIGACVPYPASVGLQLQWCMIAIHNNCTCLAYVQGQTVTSVLHWSFAFRRCTADMHATTHQY